MSEAVWGHGTCRKSSRYRRIIPALVAISAAIVTSDQHLIIYDPAQMARAGFFVGLDVDGTLLIQRGYVRAGDEAPLAPEPEIGDPETGEVLSPTTRASR